MDREGSSHQMPGVQQHGPYSPEDWAAFLEGCRKQTRGRVSPPRLRQVREDLRLPPVRHHGRTGSSDTRDLGRAADDILRLDASRRGMKYRRYLKQSGILYDDQWKQIRRREVPLEVLQ